MTWAENKSWTLNRLSHPGAPNVRLLISAQVMALGLWNQAPCQAPCWVWSLIKILSLCPSAPLPGLPLSLFKKKKKVSMMGWEMIYLTSEKRLWGCCFSQEGRNPRLTDTWRENPDLWVQAITSYGWKYLTIHSLTSPTNIYWTLTYRRCFSRFWDTAGKSQVTSNVNW